MKGIFDTHIQNRRSAIKGTRVAKGSGVFNARSIVRRKSDRNSII